ncbi:hypothetical protein BH11PSE13_BH11PSE13_11660 [soil metagenome]
MRVTVKPSDRLDRVALTHSLFAAFLIVCMLATSLLLLKPSSAHRRHVRVPPVPSSDTVQALRRQAAAGESGATGQVASALLDRFDASHEDGDLFEAMVWLERDWDSNANLHAQLQSRVFERYCNHPILQWHWLCNPGE